jgi:hypothetical protein
MVKERKASRLWEAFFFNTPLVLQPEAKSANNLNKD